GGRAARRRTPLPARRTGGAGARVAAAGFSRYADVPALPRSNLNGGVQAQRHTLGNLQPPPSVATLPCVSDWGKVRLHVVTGKGGTGKSTVASALALALATRGRNVLLCEVEGRQGIARMFDVDPLPYAERRLTTGLPQADGGR